MEFGRKTGEPIASLGELSQFVREDSTANPADQVTELYLLRHNTVFRKVWQVCRNAAAADELVQEAFFRLFRHLSAGQSVDNHFHWVLTVARNLAVDMVRGRRRECPEPEGGVQEWSETLPDPAPTPEETLIDQEKSAELAVLLETLSGVQRECLLLRMRGVTFHEIAKDLEISVSVAVYQTDLAIQKLRRRPRR